MIALVSTSVKTFVEQVMNYFPDLVIHEITVIADNSTMMHYGDEIGFRPLLLKIKYEQDPSEYKVKKVSFSEVMKITNGSYYTNIIPYVLVNIRDATPQCFGPSSIRINTKELKTYTDQSNTQTSSESFYSYDIDEIIMNKCEKMLYDKLQLAIRNYLIETCGVVCPPLITKESFY